MEYSSKFVKSIFPSLLSYGAGAFLSQYRLGSRASSAIASDSVSKFPTWSTVRRPMAAPRTARRTRRRMRRAYRRVPYPRAMDHTRLVIKSTLNPVVWPAPAGGQSNAVFSFKLNDLPNYTEIVNFYSLYKIVKVVLRFHSRVDPGNINAGGTSATNQNIPSLSLAFDAAKTTAPTNANDVLDYSNAKIYSLYSGRSVSYTCYPKAINTLQGVNVAPVSDWIMTSNATIPHYGVQANLVNFLTGSGYTDIFVTYYIACKGRGS